MKKSLTKKLLAMITAAVMALGCVGIVSAEAILDAEDVKALDLSHVTMVSDTITPVQLDANSQRVQKMVARFYGQIKKKQLHLLFDVTKGVDEDDGTVINITDKDIEKKTKVTVYQYDEDKNSWSTVTTRKLYHGLNITLKKKGPVAVGINADASKLASKPKVGIKLDKTEYSIRVGESFALTATTENTSGKVTWTPAKNAKLKVDANGNTATVTGLKPGKVNVTAKVDGKSAKCKVTVLKIPVDSVSAASVTLSLGKTATIKPVIAPDNATNKKVSYKVVGPKIVNVNSKGVVKTKKGKTGSTVIRVTAKDNKNVYVDVPVTVTE